MAATSRSEIHFRCLWDLCNQAGINHEITSEIAGTIHTIEYTDTSSSTDERTPEQRAREFAHNKARVIAWAKEQFPHLLNDGPERLYDPITCDLFTFPQTHQCSGVEHTLDSAAFKNARFFNKEKFIQTIRSLPQYHLAESIILRHFWRVDFYLTHLEHLVSNGSRFFRDSPYAYIDLLRPEYPKYPIPSEAWDAMGRDLERDGLAVQANRELRQIANHMATVDLEQYVIEQGACPYTKVTFTPACRDDQLQHEVYRFVLERLGMLNAPSPSEATVELSSSSSTPSDQASIANPLKTLQSIGGLVSSLINQFAEPVFHYNPRTVVHADYMADYCHPCAAQAKKLSPQVIEKGFGDISKAIASLPEEVQAVLHFKTWERRGFADTSTDLLWGKNHLLSNLHRTLSVVREAIREHTIRP